MRLSAPGSETGPVPRPAPAFPDLTGLTASLEAAFVPPARRLGLGTPLARLAPDELAAARCVVLFVVDGCGSAMLERLQPSGAMMAHRRDTLASTFPPTTASAITTLLTGVAPAQHGLPGWFVDLEEIGAITAVLPITPRTGEPFDAPTQARALEAIATPALSERIAVDSYAVLPAEIVASAFSVRHHRGSVRRGWRGLDELVATVAGIARQPGAPRYVYAYCDQFDATAHRYGWQSAEAEAVLGAIDRAFEALLRALRGSHALVIAVADHGFVDVRAESQLSLSDVPALAAMLAQPLSGEWRCAYARVRREARAAFPEALAGAFGQTIRCIPSARLLAEGWFGPGAPHPALARRLGDYALLAEPGYALRDELPGERVPKLVGLHGGTTLDEHLVPLVVAGPL